MEISVEGKKLVKELGCLGCHIIDGKGNNFAPDLSGIGNKVNTDWTYRFLKDPKAYDPKTMIPDIVMSEEEIQNIAAYLVTLKKAGGGKGDVIPSKAGIQKKALDSEPATYFDTGGKPEN